MGDIERLSDDGRAEAPRVVVRVAGRIARVDTDTGAATPVPGTDDGYEPALSPDGRLLAFTRRPDSGGSDVWVVELDTP